MCPRSSPPSSTALQLRPARRLPQRALGNETVLVDARARRVFLMNPVAAAVWSGVQRGASPAEIVADVVARFRVDGARAEADVNVFLGQLESVGLAVRGDGTDGLP